MKYKVLILVFVVALSFNLVALAETNVEVEGGTILTGVHLFQTDSGTRSSSVEGYNMSGAYGSVAIDVFGPLGLKIGFMSGNNLGLNAEGTFEDEYFKADLLGSVKIPLPVGEVGLLGGYSVNTSLLRSAQNDRLVNQECRTSGFVAGIVARIPIRGKVFLKMQALSGINPEFTSALWTEGYEVAKETADGSDTVMQEYEVAVECMLTQGVSAVFGYQKAEYKTSLVMMSSQTDMKETYDQVYAGVKMEF